MGNSVLMATTSAVAIHSVATRTTAAAATVAGVESGVRPAFTARTAAE